MSQPLDPRLHAYRPDLAAESLKGRVDVPRFSAGRPAQVVRGVADLKRRPEAAAPLDTQLLAGEIVTVYDEADGWAWVQNRTDDYVGYIRDTALGSDVHVTSHTVRVLRTFLYPEPELKAPPRDALTMTSPVAVVGSEASFSEVRFGAPWQNGWIYTAHLAADGDVAPDHVETALAFLNTPYLWGGKSSLGLDCSGLIQVALMRAGVACPRDTDMQADAVGVALPADTVPRRGDLVYFPGHVAIALDDTMVVNANAHAMLVSIEPLADLEARVKQETGGTGITVVRRLAS